MNFQNWCNDCAVGTSCPCLGFWIRSRTRACSAQKSNGSPSVVSIWSNFVLLPGCHKILEVSSFASVCQLYPTGQCFECSKSSRILFPVACVGSDTKSCTSSSLNLVKILLSTRVLARPCSSSVKLMTPIRHCSANTELIYRTNCLEQEFCVHRISVEVNGSLTFLFLRIPRLKALILLKTK